MLLKNPLSNIKVMNIPNRPPFLRSQHPHFQGSLDLRRYFSMMEKLPLIKCSKNNQILNEVTTGVVERVMGL
jgi:hypothetical protein